MLRALSLRARLLSLMGAGIQQTSALLVTMSTRSVARGYSDVAAIGDAVPGVGRSQPPFLTDMALRVLGTSMPRDVIRSVLIIGI